MSYSRTISTKASFDETVPRVRDALSRQGFGILTEIDVNATFAAKLGRSAADEVGEYLILGACNPPLAHRAVTADAAIGVLLPCNVVVRRAPGAAETMVEAVDPATMVQLSDKPGIREVADEAGRHLDAALAEVGSAEVGSAG